MRDGNDEGVRMREGGSEDEGGREGGREERRERRRVTQYQKLKAATIPVQSYYVQCST